MENKSYICTNFLNSDSSVVNRLLQTKNSKRLQVPVTDKEQDKQSTSLSNEVRAEKIFGQRARRDFRRHGNKLEMAGPYSTSDMPVDDDGDDDWIDASSSEEDEAASTESLGLRAFCNEMINDLHQPRNLPLPEDISSEEIQFDDESSWKDGSDTLDEVIITDSEADSEQINIDSNVKGNYVSTPSSNTKTSEMQSEPKSIIDSTEVKETVSAERQLLQRRLKELEDEIAIFRKENEQLSKSRKQYEMLILHVKRDRELIAKEKEDFKKKLEQEFLQEKKRLRKQQSYSKFIKVKKDIQEKTEEVETTSSKSEMEALQQELKKQQRHWMAESGRLRMRLTSVEAERNRLKSECHRLELQKKQLQSALKEKQPVKLHPSAIVAQPKKPILSKTSTQKTSVSRTKEQPKRVAAEVKLNHIEEKNVSEVQESLTQKSENDSGKMRHSPADIPSVSDTFEKSSAFRKPRVHFNLGSDVSNNGSEETDVLQEVKHSDKTERIFENGDREIHYTSGSRKVISGDGRTTTVYFYNGDVKISLQDGTEVYYYAESGAKQTIHLDGLEILEFPNGQEERHYKDGTKHITSSSGIARILYSNGTEETKTPDGTIQTLRPDGCKVLVFPSGEREIHTADFKRREYPDGTVKILHTDGRLETRYASGRFRLKDKDGNVLMDTKYFS